MPTVDSAQRMRAVANQNCRSPLALEELDMHRETARRLAVCALAICATPALAGYYTFTDLGVLDGGSSSAVAINNLGQVAGNASVISPVLGKTEHAFLYADGRMVDLGTPGGTYSQAWAINDRGDVVGTADSPSPDPSDPYGAGDSRAFNYSDGAMRRIDALSALSAYSTGRSVNNAGQIVGDVLLLKSAAFVYSGGAVNDLGDFGGPTVGGGAYASGINNRGQVVGQADQRVQTGPSSYTIDFYAFLYDQGTLTKIGPSGSFATAINDGGQVVGAYNLPGGGFLLSNGVVTDIGSGVPNDINNGGIVVGTEYRGSRANGAFVYQDGKHESLNDLLLEPNSGWRLLEANGINDLGQIVGTAQLGGGPNHAYLLTPTDLTPVPEPDTNMLMLAGLGVLVLSVRCRRGCVASSCSDCLALEVTLSSRGARA